MDLATVLNEQSQELDEDQFKRINIWKSDWEERVCVSVGVFLPFVLKEQWNDSHVFDPLEFLSELPDLLHRNSIK